MDEKTMREVGWADMGRPGGLNSTMISDHLVFYMQHNPTATRQLNKSGNDGSWRGETLVLCESPPMGAQCRLISRLNIKPILVNPHLLLTHAC